MIGIRRQYSYLKNLERTIKVGLTSYLVLLVVGLTSIIVGPQEIGLYLRDDEWMVIGILLGGTGILYGILYQGAAKIKWIGGVHFWLDQKFFGFLLRSNDVIFRALILSLDPGDWAIANTFSASKRVSVTQSIFSQLTGEERLFGTLMGSGIFRYWILYWVINYGTFAFSVLTLGAFLLVLRGSDPFAKTLFTVSWVVSLIHLASTIMLGNRLVRMTSAVAETIARSYGPEIAAMFRIHLSSEK